MESIMTRDSEGNVHAGGVSATIPRDELALSMLSNNPLIHKGSYEEDGWIYVDGKPVRKWYKQVFHEAGGNPVMIWPPVLDDISLLEYRYRRMMARRDKFVKEVWKPTFDKIVKVEGAHAKPTHKYTVYQDKTWWLYSLHDYYETKSVSFDWVVAPDKPKDHEIGQAFYHAQQDIGRYNAHLSRFAIVLEAAINKLLRDRKPDKPGVTLKLNINERTYWYTSAYNKYSVLIWLKVSWPEGSVVEINI